MLSATVQTDTLPPRNLCELMLRDIASLLATSEIVRNSAEALRPQCSFSRELTRSIDAIIAASGAGAWLLHRPLEEAGAVLPPVDDRLETALLTDFLARLPSQGAPGVQAVEVAVNLRLLVQHLELKARLVGEEALLVGQSALCDALMQWMNQWRACTRLLRGVTVRARARAYVADLDELRFAAASSA